MSYILGVGKLLLKEIETPDSHGIICTEVEGFQKKKTTNKNKQLQML